MLARIPVSDVFDAVTARLDMDEREEPPQIALDAMDPAALASLGEIEQIDDLPIPHPDFALDHIALTRATHDLKPILKEAFRVLRPEGTLYLTSAESQDINERIIKCGFTPLVECEVSHVLACRKCDTWPRPCVAAPPTLTHAVTRR